MDRATSRRPQLTMGSLKEKTACQPPIFLPIDLRTEWDLVVRGHHNLMLVGTPSVTNELFVAMKPHFREPLLEYMPTAGESVLQPREGTLVLLEVARLDAKQQRQLLQWLDQIDEHLQVVSTTAEPLFSLVQAGAFLADLYYKLNVVLMDLIDAGGRT